MGIVQGQVIAQLIAAVQLQGFFISNDDCAARVWQEWVNAGPEIISLYLLQQTGVYPAVLNTFKHFCGLGFRHRHSLAHCTVYIQCKSTDSNALWHGKCKGSFQRTIALVQEGKGHLRGRDIADNINVHRHFIKLYIMRAIGEDKGRVLGLCYESGAKQQTA
ncbi:hypothetical protein D3C87_1613850 [compost metagenome]